MLFNITKHISWVNCGIIGKICMFQYGVSLFEKNSVLLRKKKSPVLIFFFLIYPIFQILEQIGWIYEGGRGWKGIE